MIKMRIDGHLLIPFGRPKWDIGKIRISGVSTTATYFESETPCVYIDMEQRRPLRLAAFRKCFPDEFPSTDPKLNDPESTIAYIRDHLKTHCEVQTDAERRFLDHYFEHIVTAAREPTGGRLSKPAFLFAAPLPLPQAHLYLQNPFDDIFTFVPSKMVKVDFAFWTGNEIVAVEIDGGSHLGSENHVTKDRALLRAGVHLVHILNKEVFEYGDKVISQLLPTSVAHYWAYIDNEDGIRHPLAYERYPIKQA